MHAILRTIETVSGLGAVGCLTGYDCPSCNYVMQTGALCICVAIALVCEYIIEQRGNH